MKKSVKIFLIVLVVIAIGVFAFFANAYLGNPVSKTLAKRTAAAHLDTYYGNTDCEIERVVFNNKTGDYTAFVRSSSSEDPHFELDISMLGKLIRDNYEAQVLSGSNTANRLLIDYRALTNAAFLHPEVPFTFEISYGRLEFIPREFANSRDAVSFALIQEDFSVDGQYDVRELGARAGHLCVYAAESDVTMERAAQILLELKEWMNEQEAPFYAVDFVLRHEEKDEARIEVQNFLYSDIYEEGMVERVKAANEAAIAYHAQRDAK